MSTLHHDLKQVEMDVLAVYQAGQHKQHQYTMVNIPRPSQLPIHHYRHPIELADPPCCWGSIQSWSTSTSHYLEDLLGHFTKSGKLNCLDRFLPQWSKQGLCWWQSVLPELEHVCISWVTHCFWRWMRSNQSAYINKGNFDGSCEHGCPAFHKVGRRAHFTWTSCSLQ